MKAIIFLLALAALCSGRAFPQDANQPAVTLAERIADTGSGAKVMIGSLPPGWVLPVPAPNNAMLLGSVLYPSTGLITLYYQSSDRHATYDAYTAALSASGFIAEQYEAPLRGFATSESAGIPAQRAFCKGALSIYVMAPSARPGDFRLSIWPPQPNMTRPCGLERPAIPQRVNPLPLFAPPAGTQFEPITNEFTGQVFSGVPEFAVSAANIAGNASLKETWDSIASQLVTAGWQVSPTITLTDTASAELTLGSGADAWRGVLMMFPGAKPDVRVAYISAAGGTLNTAQAARAQQMHLAQVAQPFRKSDEPLLVHLMQRLLATYSLPRTLYVGRVPPHVSRKLPLPAQAPIGSTETQLPDNPMVVNEQYSLYYTLSKSELSSYYTRLKALGWWQLTSPDNKGSGFYGPQEGGIASFCKSGLPAIMIQTRPDTNANDVNIDISRGCGSLQQEIAQFGARFGPMPPIVAPQGVTMSGGQPGVPLGTSGAKFHGASSLSQLLDSFSAQLVAAGWKAGERSASARVGSRTFTVSRGGRRWQAVVTVYASAAEAQTYYGFIDLTNLP